MSEYAALLTAIRHRPREDTPRLAFADWLEEHGKSGRCPKCAGRGCEANLDSGQRHICTVCRGTGTARGLRAEFIRVQCELERVPACGARDPVCAYSSGLLQLDVPCPACEWPRKYGAHYAALSGREEFLLALDEAGGRNKFLLDAGERAIFRRFNGAARFRRGFLSWLSVADEDELGRMIRLARTNPLDWLDVSPQVWMGHAEDILALHPDPLVTFCRAPVLHATSGDSVCLHGRERSHHRYRDLGLSRAPAEPLALIAAVCRAEWPGVRFNWERSLGFWPRTGESEA